MAGLLGAKPQAHTDNDRSLKMKERAMLRRVGGRGNQMTAVTKLRNHFPLSQTRVSFVQRFPPGSLERMAGKNFMFATRFKEVGTSAEEITLENAGTQTIFQLRQELTRRGIFDEVFGPDGEKRSINFESCLQVNYWRRLFPAWCTSLP